MQKLLMKTFGFVIVASLAFSHTSTAKVKRKSKYKTQKQAQQMHLKAVRKQDAKLKVLNNRLIDFSQILKVSPGLRTETGAQNVYNKTVIEYRNATKALNKLTQTTYANYATARGYTLIPYPPTVAPPQPPKPKTSNLTVSFKEVRKDPKSKRPPGGPARQ